MTEAQEADVKESCKGAYDGLKTACSDLEQFLNEVTLSDLVRRSAGDKKAYEAFYRSLLSDFRHLYVYCENAYERLGLCLRRASFPPEQAMKILYWVYHKCIHTFFCPKGEAYEEESRYCFTGNDAIRFRKEVPSNVRTLTMTLQPTFEKLREDLQPYGDEYQMPLQSV